MRTLSILLAAGLALSFSGVASAASTSVSNHPASVTKTQTFKTTTKRRVVRKALPSHNKAMPVFSDKGWIAVSKTSNAKTAILQPKTTKSRTPNMFGK